jgi:hypothetical protein
VLSTERKAHDTVAGDRCAAGFRSGRCPEWGRCRLQIGIAVILIRAVRLAAELERLGYVNQRGKQFSAASVRSMLA